MHWPKEMLVQDACWKRFRKDLERIAHLDEVVPADLFGVPEPPGPVERQLRMLRGEPAPVWTSSCSWKEPVERKNWSMR